jgi:serine/threonine protein kinase
LVLRKYGILEGFAYAFCRKKGSTMWVFVQEFCNGGSLRDALSQGLFRTQHMPQRWLPLMHVLTNIANGMVYIHGCRICHGDLNPSNLLFKVRVVFVLGLGSPRMYGDCSCFKASGLLLTWWNPQETLLPPCNACRLQSSLKESNSCVCVVCS